MRASRASIAVFLTILVPRIALLLLIHPWEASVRDGILLTGDALGYHERALSVFGAAGFYPPDPVIDPYRPPLYPIFLAAIYQAFGVRVWVALLVQGLLAAATGLLLYRMVRKEQAPDVAGIVALAFALDPFLVLNANLLLSEVLFLFLCVVGFSLLRIPLVSRLEPKTRWAAFAAGLCFGLATLTRPITLLLPLAVLPLLFFVRPRPSRLPVVAGLLFATALVVVVSPWMLRNRALYGVASISVAPEYSALAHNVVGPVEAAKKGETDAETQTRLFREAEARMVADGLEPDSLNDFRQAKYWRQVTWDYVRRDPLAYLVHYGKRLMFFFGGLGTDAYAQVLRLPGAYRPADFDNPRLARQMGRDLRAIASTPKAWIGLGTALWLAVSYLCLLVGLVVCWRNGMSPFLLGCLALSLFFVAVGGGGGEGRYRLPALVFYLPFLAIGGRSIWTRWRAALPRSRGPRSLPRERGPG